MKKFTCVICITALLVLTLAGCGSVPDMTEEQEEMVSEYAVSLLLKYDEANHSRLVDVDSTIAAYEAAKKLHDQAEEAYYKRIEEEENKRREEAQNQDDKNSEYSQNTAASDNDGNGHGNDGEDGYGRNDGSGGAVVVDNASIEEFLGLSGFGFVYAGFDIMNDYPEDSMDFVPYISASEGGDLCVVYFNVTNMSSDSKTLDILNMVPMTYFKLAINGDNFHSVLRTLLEDDMAVYEGDFAPGETKRLVLITEVREGTQISTVDLRITQGSDSLTKSLR